MDISKTMATAVLVSALGFRIMAGGGHASSEIHVELHGWAGQPSAARYVVTTCSPVIVTTSNGGGLSGLPAIIEPPRV